MLCITFLWVARELGAADLSKCPVAPASSAAPSQATRWGWESGHQQHGGPQTQDVSRSWISIQGRPSKQKGWGSIRRSSDESKATLQPEYTTNIKFCFLELIFRKLRFQLHKTIFWNQLPENYIPRIRLWFRKLHVKLVLELFSAKSHISYIKECFRNYFRNNFRLECSLIGDLRSLSSPFTYHFRRSPVCGASRRSALACNTGSLSKQMRF